MANNRFKAQRLGYKGVNLKGYSFTVTEYNNANSLKVTFDNTGFTGHTSWRAITQGKVKDPFEPSVRGVGVLGLERARDAQGAKLKSYAAWECMLQRCYDPLYHKIRPTYKNVSVCEEWLSYSIFKSWFDINYKEGFHLDKDLTLLGNRVYSPETCCYIPHKVNCLLENVKQSEGVGLKGVSAARRGKYQAKVSRAPDQTPLTYTNSCEVACREWYISTKTSYILSVANIAYANGDISRVIRDNLLNLDLRRY